MSGGYFDYDQYRINDIAAQVEQLIRNNDEEELNDWGDPIGRHYSKETIEEFSIGLLYLRLASVYAQRIDWLLSGDDGEESFHKRLEEDIDEIISKYCQESEEEDQ